MCCYTHGCGTAVAVYQYHSGCSTLAVSDISFGRHVLCLADKSIVEFIYDTNFVIGPAGCICCTKYGGGAVWSCKIKTHSIGSCCNQRPCLIDIIGRYSGRCIVCISIMRFCPKYKLVCSGTLIIVRRSCTACIVAIYIITKCISLLIIRYTHIFGVRRNGQCSFAVRLVKNFSIAIQINSSA